MPPARDMTPQDGGTQYRLLTEPGSAATPHGGDRLAAAAAAVQLSASEAGANLGANSYVQSARAMTAEDARASIATAAAAVQESASEAARTAQVAATPYIQSARAMTADDARASFATAVTAMQESMSGAAKTAQAAATLFSVATSELMADPAVEDPGAHDASLTPRERWLLRTKARAQNAIEALRHLNIDVYWSPTAVLAVDPPTIMCTSARQSWEAAREAPTWIADDSVQECMLCEAEFGLVQRRHHCRACGFVVCKTCMPDGQVCDLPKWITPDGTIETPPWG